MAFNLMGFASGVAENIADTMKEDRERAQKMVDDSLRLWTELGMDKYRQRKEKRTGLSTQARNLKSEGFSNDQIDVILGQGKGEAVLGHIEKMRGSKIEVSPADIVRFAPDYKDSGRTIDQILDGVMGKVNRGMNPTDAIIDTTGGSVKGTFGIQNIGGIMQKRVDAFSNAFGIDAGQMRALAMDDITYTPGVSGQIFMEDPVAAKQAEDAMSGSETGARSFGSASTYMRNYGYAITGGEQTGINSVTGDAMYTPDIAKKGIEVDREVSRLLQKKSEETGRNQFTPNDIFEIETELQAWADSKGYKLGGSTTPPGPVVGSGGSGNTVTGPQTQTGMGVYAGMATNTIENSVVRDAKGLSGPQQTQLLAQARNAIIADLSKSMTQQDAIKEADRIIADIQTKI